ncbi:low molecular weight protein-tyrosine-phosphatase [Lactococcus termiticola]|uniref:protein-tyrosine-phosphatase n=1 Tax=Lactococcus termiticola TaxID=2169526 RepID=A0A2R5HH43_9LACT|nr:low molecular weight protein-tyrosine-phosphatase [Lactococcus termiticola]GBG97302.1 protein-tyrosine phosphatase [Lactococcus termiticola]
MKRKLLFVCLGNICRSPMAEFVMKDLAEKAGRAEDFEIESRGTSDWEHGNPIHKGTQGIFKQYEIPYSQSKASLQIRPEDFGYFDEIYALDSSNYQDLQAMSPASESHKIKMLVETGVPDPWYTGDFEETYRLVKSSCQKILDEM